MKSESSFSAAPNNDTGATIIDEDVEIHGAMKVKGNKNVVVRGTIIGEIESNGTITVDGCGVIRGAIEAKDLIVSGRIETDQAVSITGLLTMLSGGVLIASKISYGDLSHERGARISGQLESCARVESDFRVERPAPVPLVTAGGLGRSQGGALGRSMGAILGHSAGPIAAAAVNMPKPVDGVAPLPFHADAAKGVGASEFTTEEVQTEERSRRELEGVGA